MKYLNSFMLALFILLGILSLLFNVIVLYRLDDLEYKTLLQSNRIAFIEGHMPSLDLNDERMYEYVDRLNTNDQTIELEIKRIKYLIGDCQ